MTASRSTDSRTLRAMTGIITVISKAPAAPAIVTVASLPTTWAQAMATASQTTGLTLPGMMLEPGWRSGRWISARPVRGPEDIQRRSLHDLRQRHGEHLERSAQLDDRVLGGLGLDVVLRLAEGHPGPLAQPGDDPGGHPRRRVEPGPDRRASQRQLGRGVRSVPRPGRAPLDLGPVAAHLRAESDRHGVHEVGAARLHDVGERQLLAAQSARRGGRAPVRGRRARRAWRRPEARSGRCRCSTARR